MRKVILSFIVILALVLNCLSMCVFANEAETYDYEVEQWKRTEIELVAQKEYDNPVWEVEISATFTHSDGTAITLPGFWDGGDSWKVRFAPTKLGKWSFTVTSTNDDTGLNNVSGTILCTKNTGTTNVDKHGFVKLSGNNRYFTYDDDTPFFWLGDTHWQAPDYERLEECNYPNCDGSCGNSQFVHLLNERQDKGFNVFQTYTDTAENDGGNMKYRRYNWWEDGLGSKRGENFSEQKFYRAHTTSNQRTIDASYAMANGFKHLNPEAFDTQLDVMMDKITEHDMIIALGFGVATTTIRMNQESLLKFARYMVARYASYPVVWITGQEVDLQSDYPYESWVKVMELIDELDGYQHPLTGHMTTRDDYPTKYDGVTWHDWWALQGSHGTVALGRPQSFYKSYWDKGLAYLETEACYEYMPAMGGSSVNNATNIRKIAWRSLNSGSYGYTYGADGVWVMQWENNTKKYYTGNDEITIGWATGYTDHAWYEAVQFPGTRQISYLKNFYDRIDWVDLVPTFGEDGCFSFDEYAMSVDGNDTFVVYMYNTSTTTGTLKGMDDDAVYAAYWYNTQKGKFSIISNDVKSTSGTWMIPEKPDASDWTLLVTKTPLELTDDDIEYMNMTNVALYATASSSTSNSYGGHYASNAVDGNTSTHWCASDDADPQWLKVDLGKKYNVSIMEFDIHTTSLNPPCYKFILYGSNNDMTWDTVLDASAEGIVSDENYTISSPLTNASYRYFKLYVTDSQNGWTSLYEFRLLAEKEEDNSINMAIGATATASSTSHNVNNPASMAVDNNLSTYWCSANKTWPVWLKIDLSENTSIDQVQILPQAVGASNKYIIQGSYDNSTWVTLADHSSESVTVDSDNRFVDDLTNSNYRYYQIVYSEGNWPAVQEFRLLQETSSGKDDGETLTNVALGKDAKQSTYNWGTSGGKGYLGTSALDGNYNTYWCTSSDADPQALTVDLGQQYDVNEMRFQIFTTATSLPYYKYKLLASNDSNSWDNNTNWILLADRTEDGVIVNDDYIISEELENCSYRYFKLLVTESQYGWTAIREFMLFTK